MTERTGQTIEFPCLKVKQPIGEFYIGVMNHEDLITISYSDIRRLESGSEMREVEIYSGIQRELSRNRVAEISRYVNLVDATFPTSVILQIDQDNAVFNESQGTLTIPFARNVAKVLDGQHRIAGLEFYPKNDQSFQINVTIFIGMELEDQAIVFATINKTQTKVNKSLVHDLFSFATHRSPQKTAHNVIRALNERKGSPFKDKVKILGTANDIEKETITQATFAESLMKYFSKDLMSDRDLYKRGKKPGKFQGHELIKRPLRNLFIDEADGVIANIIWNYFDAVRRRWPNAWDLVEKEMILNKSTGFLALMKFFRDAYVSFDQIGSVIPASDYGNIFENVSIKDQDFNRQNYLPGSGGQAKLYGQLIEQSGLKKIE